MDSTVFDSHLWRDLRDALRTLRRSPALTAIIVVTLALGIGVNSALFTLFRLVHRPLPGQGTVVRFEAHVPGEPQAYVGVSYAEYLHLRDRSTTLSAVTAAHIRPLVVSGGDPSQVPPLVLGEFVSDAYFDVFEVPLARGRAFTRDESATPGGDAVVVLSHAFWQQHLGGRDDAIGRSVAINGVAVVVIGVATPEFVQPGFGWKADVWLPITMAGRVFPAQDRTFGTGWYEDTNQWFTPYARVAVGRTLAEARAEIRVLLGQRRDARAQPRAQHIDVTPMTVLGGADTASSIHHAQPMAMAATTLVLLIACTNIAALLLARATARGKEIAVRVCLGASRGRLMRQFLGESLLLAAIGGAAGLLLAWWSLHAFLATSVFTALGREDLVPIARLHITPDLPVLAFTAGVSCVGCLLFGLLPTWRATRGDLFSTMKDAAGVMGLGGSRDGGRSRLRSGLIVGQAALSLMLLIATGLLVRGIDRVQRVEPSVDPRRTLLLTVWMRQARYDVTRAQQIYRDLEEQLRALPGVTGVGRAGSIPGLEESEEAIRLPDAEAADGTANGAMPAMSAMRGFVNSVTPGYFEILTPPAGTAIVRGRTFTEDERRRGDAVVVTASLARRLWPDRDPLGQRLDGPTRGLARVVGVARDATDAFGAPRPLLYVPLDPSLEHDMRARVLVRVAGDAADLLSAVSTTAHTVDPSLHMTVDTMAAQMTATSTFRLARAASVLSASLGMLALALASLGFYGVMAFMVSRRTREIGVRIALGADRRDVRRLVLRQGLRLGVAGVIAGLVGGAMVARVLSSLLFGLSPFDPIAYLGASLLLLAIVLLASVIPARRAMRVNPIVSLRRE